jgi:hypothetical protein
MASCICDGEFTKMIVKIEDMQDDSIFGPVGRARWTCEIGCYDGNCYSTGFSDGQSYSSGRSSSFVRWLIYVTSICDPIEIEGCLLFTDGGRHLSWDSAWKIATKKEKLVLIQWMNLR